MPTERETRLRALQAEFAKAAPAPPQSRVGRAADFLTRSVFGVEPPTLEEFATNPSIELAQRAGFAGMTTPLALGGELLGGAALASRFLRGAKRVPTRGLATRTPTALTPGALGGRPITLAQARMATAGTPTTTTARLSVPAPQAIAGPAAAPAVTVPIKPRVTAQDFLRLSGQRAAARTQPPPKTFPVTKSKRELSEIQGLTKNDVEYLQRRGFDPSAAPTRESLEALFEGRTLRTAAHRTGAEQGAADVLARMKSEKGAVSLGLLKDVGRGLNQLRVGSMLSGLAIPKNILGGASAIGSAAVEGTGRSFGAPFREALRVPTNLKTAVRAFRQGANPSAISGAERLSGLNLNLPGRIIGAIDTTTAEALTRAGVPLEDVQRLLLTSPRGSEVAKGLHLTGPVGRALFPFQRTPFNVFGEGFNPANVNTPRKAALTLGFAGGGAAAGKEIRESKLTTRQKTLALGLLGAAAGPRAIPTMISAGLLGGAGRQASAGLSPLPEFGFPTTTKQLVGLGGFTPSALRVREVLAERRRTRRTRRRRRGQRGR